MTHTNNIGDPNLTFVDGFRTTGLEGTLTLRVNQCQDTYDLDDLLAWAYKENTVGPMFRTRDNQGCAMVRFRRNDCTGLVRKLTKMLQEADNTRKPL
jgi:hypothetical protein